MIPEWRLVRSFVASWALHVGLALVVSGWLLGGVERPSLTILELVGPPDPGPGPSAASPLPTPARNQVAMPRSPPGLPPPAAVPFGPEPAQVGSATGLLTSDSLAVRSAEIPRHDSSAGGGGSEGGQLTGPRVGYRMIPRYPESARRAGAQGTTVLRVRVLADGSVGEVRVDRSAGSADLDAAAGDAAKHWRFEPARRVGEPVSVWVLIPIRFTLE